MFLDTVPHPSKLNPRLTEADQFEIIKVTTDSIIPAPTLSPNTKRKDITVVSGSLHTERGRKKEIEEKNCMYECVHVKPVSL